MPVILAISTIIIIFGIITFFDWISHFKKCKICKSRFNYRLIHGQFNCSWYECKCKKTVSK